MKTHSQWILKLISALLKIAWYANLVYTIFILFAVTWKFCTSDFSNYDAEVQYAIPQKGINLVSLSPNAINITLQPQEAVLKMQLRVTAWRTVIFYFSYGAFQFFIMTIIHQLRKFFGTLKQGITFKYSNIRQLKIAALCFALLTPLHMCDGLITAIILKQNVKDFNLMHMVWNESFLGLMLGAVIYIMADVFKYGFALQQENEEFV
jgi:hypothetical protein